MSSLGFLFAWRIPDWVLEEVRNPEAPMDTDQEALWKPVLSVKMTKTGKPSKTEKFETIITLPKPNTTGSTATPPLHPPAKAQSLDSHSCQAAVRCLNFPPGVTSEKTK